MAATVVSTGNAEHYRWGGPTNSECDAWYLVRTAELNVIEERMPPGASETAHRHVRARQFFYVLEGELAMTIEEHEFTVRSGQGIEVTPGQVHRAANRQDAPLRILVTSQPPSHADRVEE